MERIKNLLKASHLINRKQISGAKLGEKALLIALKERGIVFVADFVEAVKLKRNLTALGKSCEIISCGREVGIENDENLRPFATALVNYINHKTNFLICLPNACITKFDKSFFLNPVEIVENKQIEIIELCKILADFGYRKVSLVSSPGEFAVRGEIFDIFPVDSEIPVRCVFFDNIIESIAYFNQNDMKTGEKIKIYKIFPAVLFKGNDKLSDFGVNIIDQFERFVQAVDVVISSFKVMQGYDETDFCSLNNFDGADLIFSLAGGIDISSGAEVSYLHSFGDLIGDVKHYLAIDDSHNKVILFAGDKFSKNRLKNFFEGNAFHFFDYEEDEFTNPGLYISEKYFPSSFNFEEIGVFAIGSDNLSKQRRIESSSRQKEIFYQPRIGEYVVHEFHGIGKCVGIERLKLADFEKDYFVIEYRSGGVLYLPSEQANSLSAYVGGDNTPHLNSLGGKEFEQIKKRVKEKLEGFAVELMELYKERQNSHGFMFKAEEFLENEFASAFEFELTSDQAQAINEVLNDMSSSKIMDRLLCGDVGFGKTEVAYRAIMRCVLNSKQVAMLCPTTVLSEQHLINAKKRFEGFGVKVEVLNRFKTTAQVKEILAKLKAGEIDLLIGTHKILSQNVVFKDLGLLVIDEEQRFGVMAKEKIKNLRKNIDVLALSATPIPRTLHMSLSGIRDISVIATPPKDRLPIQTYVTEQDDEIVSSVLKRELARGGKAFVIYNRVQSIFSIASHIAKLVPEANIGVAHGQMSEKELQSVIDRLFQGYFNVFVSTTLIENGIDLPSANTMIVFDSDLLGLGQLYQLRGRIGRSDKLSYAYLFYKSGKLLTENSYKRLESIKEFKELGSGFKISMRDLEIRGAGNIFGKEQHGHIEKIGYDMFIKLLNETVNELSGNKVAKERPVRIDLPVDAFIPDEYIPTSEQRIDYYMKISQISSIEQMESIFVSLSDGYGDVPFQTVNLAKIAYIKNLASLFGVKEIKCKDEVNIVLYKDDEIADKRLVGVLSSHNASLKFENLPIIKMQKLKPMQKTLDNIISFFEDAKKS